MKLEIKIAVNDTKYNINKHLNHKYKISARRSTQSNSLSH